MSSLPDSTPSPSRRALSDRVREQVDHATSKLPGAKRRRKVEKPSLLSLSESPRELKALHHVFEDMGRSQRAARQQAGMAPSPVVREAAQAFRRAPSFAALVLVAASLEEVGLLAW